jgi:hypothetical protein
MMGSTVEGAGNACQRCRSTGTQQLRVASSDRVSSGSSLLMASSRSLTCATTTAAGNLQTSCWRALLSTPAVTGARTLSLRRVFARPRALRARLSILWRRTNGCNFCVQLQPKHIADFFVVPSTHARGQLLASRLSLVALQPAVSRILTVCPTIRRQSGLVSN